MNNYKYKWKYWLAWRPVKDVNGKWGLDENYHHRWENLVRFTGSRKKGISVMVPLDHMGGWFTVLLQCGEKEIMSKFVMLVGLPYSVGSLF